MRAWTKQCGYGPVVNPAEMHLSKGTVKQLLVNDTRCIINIAMGL